MLESLKNIFSTYIVSEKEKNKDPDINTDIDILSGLMVEAANSDGKITQVELDKISSSLINIFKEDSEHVKKSLSRALVNKDNSNSLYFYTSKLNKSLSNQKKILLIEVLWEVILSDNEIHDFESNLIRRLAGLFYISDVECGNAKFRASQKVHKK